MEEKNGIATLVKIHFFKSKLDLKINTMEDYLEVNKASWNNRLEAHLSSDFYNLEEEESSYADRNAALKQKFVGWNHGLAKVDFLSLKQAIN